MTTIRIGEERALVEEEIETYYEKEITPIGNSAKVGVPKRYRGQEALVIILAVED
jgi:putative transposon-encoded protein